MSVVIQLQFLVQFLSVSLMLKFSKKSSNKNSGTYFEEINIGLWNFDVIEGGILADSYPEANKIVKADVISEKIKDIILIQSKSNSYKNDWSLSPIKIEDSHFYLYGFFTTKWSVVSIQLPIKFSNWLIYNKSALILFESIIQDYNFDYLPEDQWITILLKPLYGIYHESFDKFLQENIK